MPPASRPFFSDSDEAAPIVASSSPSSAVRRPAQIQPSEHHSSRRPAKSRRPPTHLRRRAAPSDDAVQQFVQHPFNRRSRRRSKQGSKPRSQSTATHHACSHDPAVRPIFHHTPFPPPPTTNVHDSTLHHSKDRRPTWQRADLAVRCSEHQRFSFRSHQSPPAVLPKSQIQIFHGRTHPSSRSQQLASSMRPSYLHQSVVHQFFQQQGRLNPTQNGFSSGSKAADHVRIRAEIPLAQRAGMPTPQPLNASPADTESSQPSIINRRVCKWNGVLNFRVKVCSEFEIEFQVEFHIECESKVGIIFLSRGEVKAWYFLRIRALHHRLKRFFFNHFVI